MKKIKNWYNKRNEQGSSLLEVIVAVVILAVVGSTLLGGLNSANLAQRKTAQVAFAENQMQMGTAAQAGQAQQMPQQPPLPQMAA